MQDKGKNWLSDYAPAEIAPINDDPTTVKISSISSHFCKKDKIMRVETLTIPARLINDPLSLAIIAYCKSEGFVSQAPSTRNNKYKLFQKIFIFLEKHYGEQGISDVTAIHPDYINYMKKGKGNISSIVSSINVVLKWYLEEENHNPEHIARIKATQARIPKISRDPGKPRGALSELIESIGYDDPTLIKSLREFCVVMLKIMREQREYLLSFPEIIKAQSSLSYLSNEVRSLIVQGVNTSHKVNFDLTQAYFKPIWDAISSSNDGLLIERMLLNCSYTRSYIQNCEAPITLEEQKVLLGQHLNLDGSLRSSMADYYTKALKKKGVVSAAKFFSLSYDSLCKPTKVEETLISLLLASERIQPSGQFELSIEDYYVTGNNGSWDFSKNRAFAIEHPSIIYSNKSPVHQTYLGYVKLCSLGGHDFSVGRSLQSTQGRLTFRYGTEFDPYLSVALKGSYLRSWLFNVHPKTKPFVELLTKICEHNDLIYNSYGKHKKGMKSISLSHVAQSVAIMSTRRNFSKKQSAYEKYGRSTVDAALDAHTPEVKKNIYINRSETITRINERKWFSEIVSEEMVKDALNIKKYLSNYETKVLSLTEARKILGLKGEKTYSDEMSKLGDFFDECDETNFKAGSLGDLTFKSQKIVIELPITAALMLSYQSEIEKEFKKDKYISNRRKAFILSRYLYVEDILNSFEPSTIDQGNKLLEQFDIPSPPIFVEDV